MRELNSHLRGIEDQDGAVVLNTAAGTIMTLNATGAFVWRSMERGAGPDQIAQDLANETGEDVTAVRQDLLEFFHSLKRIARTSI